MNLLAGVLYDPATAVSKSTTAALAMTALDTVNLRLTVKAPPSGKIFWRCAGALHGATTCPQIMLGVMRGSTVMARAAPMHGATNIAATSLVKVEAEGLITGLTPGQQYVLDAAYGVETVVASTGLKYGGPNNTTANDNFGGFRYELWDPCPVYTPAEAGSPSEPAAPTSTVHDKLDTIDNFVDTEIADIQSRLPAALVGGRMDCSVGAMAAGTVTAAAIATGALDADALAADAATELADAVWASAARTLTAIDEDSTTLDLDATIRAAVGLASPNLDTQLAAIDDAVDTEVASILSTVGTILTHVDTEVAAIKTQTDKLTFTVANKLDVNVLVVNGVTVGGSGSAGDPWGPA